MSADKENGEDRPLADMPNAAGDLDLAYVGPWRFDKRDRSAVAEFAEMLCAALAD